jgi:hypothetical protein
MIEATKRPWGYVHNKGLDKHLVGATLENVAIVEDRHGNAKENADLIVRAVNAHDALVAAVGAMEWAVPTPDADADGSCPSCFAGKPAKFWGVPVYRATEFERENHMKNCQLAAALEASK